MYIIWADMLVDMSRMVFAGVVCEVFESRMVLEIKNFVVASI